MTRRLLSKILVSSLAMITGLTQTGCSDDKSHSFDRLMHARIYTKDHLAEFEGMVKSFVAKQILVIGFADFPRDEGDERTVINLQISLDKAEKTFLTIDNFVNKDVFDVGCYSHEEETRWRPFWNSFISSARDQLGYDKVVIVPIK